MMKTIGDEEEVCYLNAWHELCRYHLPEIQNVTFPFTSRKTNKLCQEFSRYENSLLADSAVPHTSVEGDIIPLTGEENEDERA